MTTPSPDAADTGHGQPGEVVRRFDSRKNVKHAEKNGIKFDSNKGNGIPATTTDIEPVDPDRIRDATGARNADAWLDIAINGKRVLRRTTKEGHKEIIIQEDINMDDVRDSGRTRKSILSDDDHD